MIEQLVKTNPDAEFRIKGMVDGTLSLCVLDRSQSGRYIVKPVSGESLDALLTAVEPQILAEIDRILSNARRVMAMHGQTE